MTGFAGMTEAQKAGMCSLHRPEPPAGGLHSQELGQSGQEAAGPVSGQDVGHRLHACSHRRKLERQKFKD